VFLGNVAAIGPRTDVHSPCWMVKAGEWGNSIWSLPRSAYPLTPNSSPSLFFARVVNREQAGKTWRKRLFPTRIYRAPGQDLRFRSRRSSPPWPLFSHRPPKPRRLTSVRDNPLPEAGSFFDRRAGVSNGRPEDGDGKKNHDFLRSTRTSEQQSLVEELRREMNSPRGSKSLPEKQSGPRVAAGTSMKSWDYRAEIRPRVF